MRTAVVLGVTLLLAGCGSTSTQVAHLRASHSPASHSTSPNAELAAALDRIPLPSGSVRLAKPAVSKQYGMSPSNSPAKVTRTGYWRSPLTRLATIAWMASHLAPMWTGGTEGTIGSTTTAAEYDQPPGNTLEGPNFTVSVADLAGGSSVMVSAWVIPLPAKSAAEILTGVIGATVRTKDPVSPMGVRPLRRVTVAPDQVQQLAAAVNALGVDDGSPRSCTDGTPEVVLDFTTVSGARRWIVDEDCGTVSLEPAVGPTLDPSNALGKVVAAALADSREPARGTLIVSLRLAGHAYNDESAPGTVVVRRGGRTVDRGSTPGPRDVTLTEPAGSYELSAVSGKVACGPAQATVVADQQVDVSVACG